MSFNPKFINQVDKPLEPRLFVVKRSGDATEIAPSAQLTDLNRLAHYCPDASCLKGSYARSSAPPSTALRNLLSIEGGDADGDDGYASHAYHVRKRLGRYSDPFSFEDVFSSRKWQNQKRPAVANLDLKMSQAAEKREKEKGEGEGIGINKRKEGKNKNQVKNHHHHNHKNKSNKNKTPTSASEPDTAIVAVAVQTEVTSRIFQTYDFAERPAVSAAQYVLLFLEL